MSLFVGNGLLNSRRTIFRHFQVFYALKIWEATNHDDDSRFNKQKKNNHLI